MKKIMLIGAIAGSSLLTGCATVVSGKHQVISVSSSPVQGAQCNLKNDKGKWQIKTPSDISIQKSGKDLLIVCKKEGYPKGVSKVKSSVAKAAYGNILLGGVVGAAVDNSSGAAFQYPVSVTVPLVKQK